MPEPDKKSFYRDPVDAARLACPSVNDHVPLSAQEACLLAVSQMPKWKNSWERHALFSFTDLGHNNPVWLPIFTTDGRQCFRFEPYSTAPSFGVLVLPTWLHNRRDLFIAKTLLLEHYREVQRHKPRPTPPWIAARQAAQKAKAAKTKKPTFTGQGSLF